MSPEAYKLAQQRIILDIKDASRLFAHAVAQRNAEISVKSSALVLVIFSMAREELEQRALRAWTVIQRLIDADDSEVGDETRSAILELIFLAVVQWSADIDALYMKYSTRMQGDWPLLVDARERAVDLSTSDVDIDLLRRRRKRMPLGDVLRAPRYAATFDHWTKARAAAEAQVPDLATALKEGVIAVEALAKRILPSGGVTLGDCIKELRSKKLIDPGADKLLEGLWVYSNAMPGIRHGAIGVVALSDQDWTILRPMLEGALTILLRVDASAGNS
jgi:hypothetical protein